jgi:hypothetical protein
VSGSHFAHLALETNDLPVGMNDFDWNNFSRSHFAPCAHTKKCVFFNKTLSPVKLFLPTPGTFDSKKKANLIAQKYE